MAKEVPFSTKLRALISAMLFNLCIGSYYMYGNINQVIYNYLKNNGNPDITPQDTLIVQPIWLIMQSVLTAVGVTLAEKLGYRGVNWLAFGSYGLVNFICAYMKNYYMMIYFYSIFAGATCGLGYLMGIYICWTYFPDKKGLVTGIILFTAGISASILSPMTTYIVNPDNNLKPEQEAMYSRVPRMFTILGIYFTTLTIIAGLLQPPPLESDDLKKQNAKKKNANKRVSLETNESLDESSAEEKKMIKNQLAIINRHELSKDLDDVLQDVGAFLVNNLNEDRVGDLVQRPLNDSANADTLIDSNRGSNQITLARKLSKEEIYKASQEIKENACPTLKAGFKSKTFAFIAAMSVCSSMYNYFFNSAWKDYGYTFLPKDISDQKISLILSAASLCNSVARLLVGILIQKISFKVLYICVVSLQIISAFTVTTVATSYYVYMFYICMSLFCLGSHVTLFPTMTTKAFGVEIGRKIYPFVYQCFSAASLAQYFIYKYIPKDNLAPLFTLFGVLSIVALVLAILFTDDVDWSQAIMENDAQEAKKELENYDSDAKKHNAKA